MSATAKNKIDTILKNTKNYTKRKELEQFYKYLKIKLGIGDSTARLYLNNVRAFIRKNDELTINSINSYLEDQNTKRNILRYLKIFAEFRYKEGKLTLEELHDIQELKKKNESPKRTKYIAEDNTNVDLKYKFSIPMEQWQDCYTQLEYETQRLALWLGFNFGLRAGEIINLQWKNINFKVNIIKVRETEDDEFNNGGFKPKTKNSIREITITPNQRQVLLDFKEKTDELRNSGKITHDYVVFVWGKRHRFQPIAYMTLFNWCKLVKFPVVEEGYTIMRELRPHALRYSFSTAIFKKHGYNGLFTLSKMLGHSDIKTTQKYLVISDQEIQSNMLDLALQAGL